MSATLERLIRRWFYPRGIIISLRKLLDQILSGKLNLWTIFVEFSIDLHAYQWMLLCNFSRFSKVLITYQLRYACTFSFKNMF